MRFSLLPASSFWTWSHSQYGRRSKCLPFHARHPHGGSSASTYSRMVATHQHPSAHQTNSEDVACICEHLEWELCSMQGCKKVFGYGFGITPQDYTSWPRTSYIYYIYIYSFHMIVCMPCMLLLGLKTPQVSAVKLCIHL